MIKIKIIKIDDKEYSSSLRKIKDEPKKLFCEGNIELLNTLCFSVIGSRKLTQYGKRIEEKFVRELALRGITIVSGMAVGGDSVAHKETLEVGGNTIAVLPCGLKNIYPKENIELFHKIVDNGGLAITEYEENVEATDDKFLKRNRIVSGLSKGVLVVEAKHRSGTSVTARLAREQGRKVFALPRKIRYYKWSWCK